MPTIEIDFDVYKALTNRRPSEDVTENDVLRRMFGLSPEGQSQPTRPEAKPGDWIVKGVRLPAGTEFRAHYKGQTFLGRVEDGALMINAQRFASPSAAAVAITGSPVNGWIFWECRLPGTASWRMLKTLRTKAAR